MSEFDRGGIEDRAAFPDLGPLDGEAGPALPLTPEALARLADQIEQRFALQQPPQPLRWRPRLAGRRFVFAGTLLAASAAAAMYGVNALRSERAPERQERSSIQVPDLPAAAARVGSEPAPPAAQAGDPQRPPADTAPDPGPSTSVREPTHEAPLTPRAEDDSKSKLNSVRSAAADRLAAANTMRSRHRYREAEALYLRIIELYPNSVPASVARVAAAEIRLEQFGDVDGAERLYREAKTKGGELTAEAQFGLAQVFRARSDAAAERRALQEFVARHPESPLVSAAQRRLQALGMP